MDEMPWISSKNTFLVLMENGLRTDRFCLEPVGFFPTKIFPEKFFNTACYSAKTIFSTFVIWRASLLTRVQRGNKAAGCGKRHWRAWEVAEVKPKLYWCSSGIFSCLWYHLCVWNPLTRGFSGWGPCCLEKSPSSEFLALLSVCEWAPSEL